MNDRRYKPGWSDVPPISGEYWMRWRKKYQRFFWTELVRVARGAGKAAFQVKPIGTGIWAESGRFPNARFFGPLTPPPHPGDATIVRVVRERKQKTGATPVGLSVAPERIHKPALR